MKNKQKQLKIKEKKFDALADLKLKEIKPRETKPKEIKPNEYSDYFIYEMAKIQKSYEPVDFNNLTYYFKNSRIPSVNFIKFKGQLHIFKSIHGCRKRANRI